MNTIETVIAIVGLANAIGLAAIAKAIRDFAWQQKKADESANLNASFRVQRLESSIAKTTTEIGRAADAIEHAAGTDQPEVTIRNAAARLTK